MQTYFSAGNKKKIFPQCHTEIWKQPITIFDSVNLDNSLWSGQAVVLHVVREE